MQPWPDLSLAAWRETYATLLLYAQIVGKIRLALTPRMNEWWNVPLYLTTRGLTTSPMPYRDRTVSIDFDFIEHQLLIQDSDGRSRTLPLVARPVCDFYREVFAHLAAMDVHVEINVTPQECPVSAGFVHDVEHCSYDPGHAHRVWEVLRRVEPVFQIFRSQFRGKCSPVHFWWGTFDLAVSRYNGRRAPVRKGLVERVAYDEEVISLGFWPGDPWTGATEAAFYSYTAPAPAGVEGQRVRPAAGFFSDKLKEFLLPYDDVRRSPDPAKAILEFAQSTYEAGTTLAGWDTAALVYP